MRARALLLLAALAVPYAAGCCRWCRCCGDRDDRLPPRDALRDPPLDVPARQRAVPPAALPPADPVANPKLTGAYGGSG